MSGLLPFFTYYGGKWRVAPKYPAPVYERIMEPFAGSAGYSLRYADREVRVNDADPIVAGTWAWLTTTTAKAVLSLPDIEAGQTVDDHLHLRDEERWLIGWWLNKGSATPKRRPSSFMLNHAAGAPYWGQGIRERIAAQLPAIAHWHASNFDYRDLDTSEPATWFIDPPYSGSAGSHYRHGNRGFDYRELAEWCRALPGQVIVCEADDANWLPFKPLAMIDGTEGRQKRQRARMELLYTTGSAERALL